MPISKDGRRSKSSTLTGSDKALFRDNIFTEPKQAKLKTHSSLFLFSFYSLFTSPSGCLKPWIAPTPTQIHLTLQIQLQTPAAS